MPVPDGTLAEWVADARVRTLALVENLDDNQLRGPRLAIVNPLGWEIGHVAWFAEKWLLRDGGAAPLVDGADRLYDSSAVAHDTRWDLPLPSRAGTLEYLRATCDAVLQKIARGLDGRARYFVMLAVFHEDMHDEAILYTHQTHGWKSPVPVPLPVPLPDSDDAEIEGGTHLLGARPGSGFVFDNEKWAHPVDLRPFKIARRNLTEREFSSFVRDRGYARRELWSDEGWSWREAARAERPLYFTAEGVREFDRERAIDDRAVKHVNAFEAEAYCRWAKRRLPTEAEWERAAPLLEHASDEIWQWTSSPFLPYPGFVVDPYADYSRPWFGNHRVLRGGAWCTRPRLLRQTWRNFYTPDRRDVWCGFRTVALA